MCFVNFGRKKRELGRKANETTDDCDFRACYGVLRFIMESGARGCEVVVSGKLRGQRAKSMKFVDGLMIHSGEPTIEYVNTATRHVLLRQGKNLFLLLKIYFVENFFNKPFFLFALGVLGIKVKIMLPHDPLGKTGPKKPLPDNVTVAEPKEEISPAQPTSEIKASKDLPPQPAIAV